MKEISFTVQTGNTVMMRLLNYSPDFAYFEEVHSKAKRAHGLSWWWYEYTIKDEQAEYLKIKYPNIVTIRDSGW